MLCDSSSKCHSPVSVHVEQQKYGIWNVKNRMDFVLFGPPQLLLHMQRDITISPKAALEISVSLKANLLPLGNNPIGPDI